MTSEQEAEWARQDHEDALGYGCLVLTVLTVTVWALIGVLLWKL